MGKENCEEEEKGQEYEVVVECGWKSSPECWGRWTIMASAPLEGGRVSHGICPPCHKIWMKEVEELRASRE